MFCEDLTNVQFICNVQWFDNGICRIPQCPTTFAKPEEKHRKNAMNSERTGGAGNRENRREAIVKGRGDGETGGVSPTKARFQGVVEVIHSHFF